jgi:hypothetical protein
MLHHLNISTLEHAPVRSQSLASYCTMASKKPQGLWTEAQIEEYKYENVWHSIFAKDVWLQTLSSTGYAPTLFGYDLHKLHYENGEEKTGKDAICYLVITIAPNIRLLKPEEYELFFECLRPHTRNGDDVTIREGVDSPMIILNINDLGKGDGSRKEEDEIVVPFLPLLFNCSITQLQSAYMLWQDTERTLKTIESDSIIGVGTERTHESVSTVCWLWLQDIWAKEERWIVQFKVPGEFGVRAHWRGDLSISHLVLREKKRLSYG